jgi:hypothetical protein
MNSTDPNLTYYVVNNVLTQMIIYCVPWILILIAILWGFRSVRNQTSKLDAANTQILSLLTEIKTLLENRKS